MSSTDIKAQMITLKEREVVAERAHLKIKEDIFRLKISCFPHPNREESVPDYDNRIIVWRCPDCGSLGSYRRQSPWPSRPEDVLIGETE